MVKIMCCIESISTLNVIICHNSDSSLERDKVGWTKKKSANYLNRIGRIFKMPKKEIKYHNAEPEKTKKTDRWNFNAKKNNDDDDDKICILLPLNGHYYVNKTQPSTSETQFFSTREKKRFSAIWKPNQKTNENFLRF